MGTQRRLCDDSHIAILDISRAIFILIGLRTFNFLEKPMPAYDDLDVEMFNAEMDTFFDLAFTLTG